MNKTAIRYLRISTDRQSNFSIDGQDMQTRHWCDRNSVEIIDTFIDEGYSAKNFDRPDMVRLYEFLTKHHRTVDYLVVNDFTRFSRDTGEALVAVKKLQKKFGVKLVSVNEGVTFDADDPGSFFYAGLMLLKGEDEIIRNRSRINLGIYTAKKKEGRYLGGAPIGYKNGRDERNIPVILVDDEKAAIVRFVYESFLANVAMNEIRRMAREKGFTQQGSSAIADILKNPVYTGLLRVKAYKDNPEELVEGIHTPLISRTDWLEVQERLSGKGKPVHVTRDDFPLRSVLLCHCSLPLTGAPSRGRHGRYYNYYKCKVSGHNTISAEKAHEQLLEVFKYMSLPDRVIQGLRERSEEEMEQRLLSNSKDLQKYRHDLEQAETKLRSVEDKWVMNQLTFESYQRLYGELTQQRMSLHAQIGRLSQNEETVWLLMQKEMFKLNDLAWVYTIASTVEKQQLVRVGFDSKLYYKEGVYRTPYIIPVFAHNELIMRERNLLYIDNKTGLSGKVRLGGAERIISEHLLQTISTVKLAS